MKTYVFILALLWGFSLFSQTYTNGELGFKLRQDPAKDELIYSFSTIEFSGLSTNFNTGCPKAEIVAKQVPVDNPQESFEEQILTSEKIRFCVFVADEGAAGSIYRTYFYLVKHPGTGRVFALVFVVRLANCYNFDKKHPCKKLNRKKQKEVKKIMRGFEFI